MTWRRPARRFGVHSVCGIRVIPVQYQIAAENGIPVDTNSWTKRKARVNTTPRSTLIRHVDARIAELMWYDENCLMSNKRLGRASYWKGLSPTGSKDRGCCSLYGLWSPLRQLDCCRFEEPSIDCSNVSVNTVCGRCFWYNNFIWNVSSSNGKD